MIFKHQVATLEIARSLCKISLLTKLAFNHDNITIEAADNIVTVIPCNKNSNFGNNLLQASGTT